MPSKACIADQLARFVSQRYPNAPAGDEAKALALSWLDDLADLDDAAFEAACRAYRNSPVAEDRWWPTPGRIRAHLPAGRAANFLGSDADAEIAFADFVRRMPAVSFRPDRDDETRHLDPADPYRNDAMFEGLRAVGGAQAWGRAEIGNPATMGSLRKTWTAAYREARMGQRRDAGALQLTAGQGQRQIGGAVA
jgi:hypothetical protein